MFFGESFSVHHAHRALSRYQSHTGPLCVSSNDDGDKALNGNVALHIITQSDCHQVKATEPRNSLPLCNIVYESIAATYIFHAKIEALISIYPME